MIEYNFILNFTVADLVSHEDLQVAVSTDLASKIYDAWLETLKKKNQAANMGKLKAGIVYTTTNRLIFYFCSSMNNILPLHLNLLSQEGRRCCSFLV